MTCANPPVTERPWPLSPKEARPVMRRYEMMIILDPSLEERTVQPSLDQFLKVVTTGGGTIDQVDVWARRRPAYEIDTKPDRIYPAIPPVPHPETAPPPTP